jgi:hypothetical protein
MVSYNKNSQNNGLPANLPRYSSFDRALGKQLPKMSTTENPATHDSICQNACPLLGYITTIGNPGGFPETDSSAIQK